MERLGPRVGDGQRMTKSIRLWLFGAIVSMAGLAAWGTAQEDDQIGLHPRLVQQAEALILARCSLCHTPDLIYQQRLPKQRWEATVDKMVRWGAQLSTEEAAVLIQYLAARYHPDAPNPVPPLHSQGHGWQPVKSEP